MKRAIILFLLVTLLNSNAFSQYFEGKVVYNNSFESKMKGVTDAQLTSLVGSKQEYYIKDGHYKSIMNGQAIVMQMYDWVSNRIYNKTPNSDTLYWFNASINTDNLISHEINNNVETILGNTCNVLIIKTKSGTANFYFSEKYKLDSNKFSKHDYGNWAFFIKKAGALPLKIIVENDSFKMTSTAVEITPTKLKEDFFAIDAKAPIKQTVK